MNNILTPSETRQAVRLGVAQAMSEAGMIPSEAEQKLAAVGAGGLLTAGMDFAEKVPLVFIGGGALAGAGLGHLHHQADQTLAGEDDPEISTLRKKTDAYHKMTADLALAEQARSPVAPAV